MRLGKIDNRELLEAASKGYSMPGVNRNGEQPKAQWKSWQKLQRLGLGFIEGYGEADGFSLTPEGRRIAALDSKGGKP